MEFIPLQYVEVAASLLKREGVWCMALKDGWFSFMARKHHMYLHWKTKFLFEL